MTTINLADGRVLNFPDETPPEVIQNTINRLLGLPSAEPEPAAPVVPPAAPPVGPPATLGPPITPVAPPVPVPAAAAAVPPTDFVSAPVPDVTRQPFGRLEPAEVVGAVGIDPRDVEGSVIVEMITEAINAFRLPGRALAGQEINTRDLLEFAATFSPAALRGGGVALRNAIEAIPSVAKADADLAAARTRVVSRGGFGARATGRAAQSAVDEGVAPLAGEPTLTELAATARAARFKEQNITATRGDISQQFAQQAEEARLVSMAGGEAAEPLRQVRLRQSEEFIASVNKLVDEELGVPRDVGESVKAALTGRRKLLREEKTALYREVAETAPEITNTPLFTDEIISSIPDPARIRRLRALAPNSVKAVEDLFVEFGIVTDPAAVKSFIDAGGEIMPLTLGNFDTFRIELRQIDQSDPTNAVKVITGPVRNALDQEASFIDDALKKSGVTDQGVIATLKRARETVRALKTEFSPESITGRLINVRRDGVTPVIEASKVADELLRSGAPIENLQRTLKSLRGTGLDGIKAINDLRASVVMGALEAALKAPSRKTSGIETIGGNQFAKALDKFGVDKLNLLFKGNKAALQRLKDLRQTALDISPTAGAVPRGSAPVILDIIKRAGRLPGLAVATDAINFVVKAGGDDRAVARALRSKPEVLRTLVTIRRDFPRIFERLGILTALELAEQQQRIEQAPDVLPREEA